MSLPKFDAIVFLVRVTTLALFILVLLLMFVPMPTENADTIKTMVNQVTAAWFGIVMYYFGSSSGSKAKTDIMNNKTVEPGSVTTTARVDVTKTTTTNTAETPKDE